MVTADNDAIHQLTKLCGHAIPEEYIRLLQEFPLALRTALRADDDDDAEAGCVADVELLADPGEIVSINLEARQGGVIDPDGEEFLWPEQLLVIGESGTGDYYCIDVSGEHSGVLQYLHQSIEFEEVAESLQEYVELLLEAYVPGSAQAS